MKPNRNPNSTAQSAPAAKLVLNDEGFPGYVAEIFRSLRIKVLLGLPPEGTKIVGITSMESGVGKTTVAANLALSLAQRGIRTLLIDSDMRCGELHTVFGLRQSPGLSEFLDSSEPMTVDGASGYVQRIGPAGLDCITCGKNVAYSAELLSLPKTRTLGQGLGTHYDVIVCDLPPIGMAVDPVALHDVITRYVLVARAGSTNIADLTKKVNEYPTVRRKTLGIVLNHATLDRQLRYYKHSKYYTST
jgi:polysaccharide biosynthesis transport protein